MALWHSMQEISTLKDKTHFCHNTSYSIPNRKQKIKLNDTLNTRHGGCFRDWPTKMSNYSRIVRVCGVIVIVSVLIHEQLMIYSWTTVCQFNNLVVTFFYSLSLSFLSGSLSLSLTHTPSCSFLESPLQRSVRTYIFFRAVVYIFVVVLYIFFCSFSASSHFCLCILFM